MTSLPSIQDQNLRLTALTHRSYFNENPQDGNHNERLEFLGDAVLGFVVGELLFKKYPQLNEAELTRLRSQLVDESQLSKFARSMELGDMIRLGKGAEKEGGRENSSLLSDALEAYLGAYFLESGIDAVRAFVEQHFLPIAEGLVSLPLADPSTNFIDAKGKLQQWALAQFKVIPKYRIISEIGSDHAKEFMAEVSVEGKVYGVGTGRRKQQAEKQAAQMALQKLGLIP